MRILIIGAGATGGFYGGLLALAGRDVTFLVRERRRAQLERTGLMLRTPTGDRSLTPRLIEGKDLAAASPFDLILLAVKAYAFEAALEDMAPAVGPETMILPLLNGMRHIEALDARFTPRNVLGGLCRIIGDMDADGRILQMTPLSELTYGERNRERTPRIEAVDAVMQGVGFDATLAANILADMWVKWMLLCSLGSINVLAHGSVGDVRAVAELDEIGRRTALAVLAETIAVATANGYPPSPQALRMMEGRLTEPGSTLESSMYRDYSRGYPVEAAQIVGDMVRRAREANIAVPLIEAALVHLRIYVARRAA